MQTKFYPVTTFCNMLILGITGTLGAGKGTVVNFLVSGKGFIHFSVRQFLLEEIRRRKLPENRDSMVTVANSLRRENSPSYIVDVLYQKAAALQTNSIIESIRTPGEVISLRAKARFFLIAVDADPTLRYERIRKRNSETDRISFDTFIENEKREMEATDPDMQNIQRCMEMADFSLQNNGSVEELHRDMELILTNILKLK
jgi:dephospho-CoA kinase